MGIYIYILWQALHHIIIRISLCRMILGGYIISNDPLLLGNIHYDDHCRICHRLGDLLCCETCPAVFHLECVEPPMEDVPEEDWQCGVCRAHKVCCVELQCGVCRAWSISCWTAVFRFWYRDVNIWIVNLGRRELKHTSSVWHNFLFLY